MCCHGGIVLLCVAVKVLSLYVLSWGCHGALCHSVLSCGCCLSMCCHGCAVSLCRHGGVFYILSWKCVIVMCRHGVVSLLMYCHGCVVSLCVAMKMSCRCCVVIDIVSLCVITKILSRSVCIVREMFSLYVLQWSSCVSVCVFVEMFSRCLCCHGGVVYVSSWMCCLCVVIEMYRCPCVVMEMLSRFYAFP